MKRIALFFSCLISVTAAHTQNVGIGTSSPAYPIHVVKDVSNVDLAMFESNGGAGNILVGNGSGYSLFGHNGNYGYTGTYTPQDFRIMTGYTTRMCFENATGNIGIGTNTPLSRLDVNADVVDSDIARFTNAGGYGQILVSNNLITTDLGADNSKGYVGTNSDHDFHIRAGGDDVVVLKNGSQYVGIGTSIPECKLNVVTDEPYSDVAIFKNTSGSSSVLVTTGTKTLGLSATSSLCSVGSYTPTDFALSTFGQNRLYISNATGNIGIGTSSPAFPLHVHSNNQDLSLAKFDCTGGYGQIVVSNGTVGTSFGVNTSKGYVGTTTNTDFGIYAGSNELIHLRQEYGYVGIGTSNPQSKFQVETNDGYTNMASFKNNSGYSNISVTNNTQYLDMGVTPQMAYIGTYNNTDFAIKTLGVNRIFIDKTNGYVGIGTDVPATALHVAAPTATDEVARFTGEYNGYVKVGTSNNSIDLGSDYNKSYVSTTGTQDMIMKLNGTERIHIKATNGNVGIGTDIPATKLHVVGNTYLVGTLVTTADVTMQTNLTVNSNLTVGNIVQPDRIPVSWFSGNFHNLGSPYEDVTYYKDKENRVHLSGIVEIVGTQTGTIFILPAGFRPLGNQVFAQMTSSGSVNRINVNNSGNVTIQGNLSGWVSMDGISFRAN